MSVKFKPCLSKIKVPCIRVLHSMKGRINDTVIRKVLLWEKLEEFGIFQVVVLVFLLLFWRHNAMVTTVIDETQRHATSAFSYSPTSLVNLLEYKWSVHVSMNGCPSLCVSSLIDWRPAQGLSHLSSSDSSQLSFPAPWTEAAEENE